MTVPNMPPQMQQSVPLIGKQRELQEQQRRQQIQAAMGQLSMQIYAQLVTKHYEEASPEKLLKLAKASQTAARCYFEGVGAIGKEDQ